MNPINMRVGAWLLQTGHTKKQLADYLRISDGTLDNRLDGSYEWKWEEVKLLAVLFECTTDSLR